MSQTITGDAVCPLPERSDYVAPDGSEIRLLALGEHGGMAHCRLNAGQKSVPIRHRSVEELWFVLKGACHLSRAREGEVPRQDTLRAGDSVRIQAGTAFQFKALPGVSVEILIATMPPWPGPTEAIPARGVFEPE
jgi:mannose-6-phosphate isomerase-like protein (cupin superfamily)